MGLMMCKYSSRSDISDKVVYVNNLEVQLGCSSTVYGYIANVVKFCLMLSKYMYQQPRAAPGVPLGVPVIWYCGYGVSLP